MKPITMAVEWLLQDDMKKFEPPRRVDDGDSQTKKIIVCFSWNFLLHRCPSDF